MKKFLSTIIFLLAYNGCYASPWFTGPLLASAGKIVPYGHVNLEIYGFHTKNIGEFNRHWKLIHSPGSETIQLNPLLAFGLSEHIDVQLSVPYAINHSQGKTGKHLGDTSVKVKISLA